MNDWQWETRGKVAAYEERQRIVMTGQKVIGEILATVGIFGLVIAYLILA
jgi:hypothetical protein